MDRPDIVVVDVLDYYDGPLEFLARYIRFWTEAGNPIHGLIYGCLSAESPTGRNDYRIYDLWMLPPWNGPEWQITENELEYENE